MIDEVNDAVRPGDEIPVLEDLPDPAGKAAIVRATFDRPLAADPTLPLALARAQGLAATIEWLADRGARVTVCGDTGVSGPAEERNRLACIRREVGSFVSAAVLPAVSFRPCPEDPEGVAELIEDHDLFVNDTLQDSSLPLPSLTLPPRRLPSAAGRSLEHDLRILGPLLVAPARPFVAVLGGERSYRRLHGLEGLVLRADAVLVGGAMSLPLLEALGRQPDGSASGELLSECRRLLGLSRRVHHQIVVPLDLVWRGHDGTSVVTPADRRGGADVVDIGPVTRVRFAEAVRGAGVTLWAGSLGRVEDRESATGTYALAASFGPDSALVLGGDALVGALRGSGLVPPSAEMLSATDAAIELVKAGDLPALAALRRSQGLRSTSSDGVTGSDGAATPGAGMRARPRLVG